MKYKRFEDLPVWQAAARLSAEIIDWTDDRSFRGIGDLANQLQRASLSISNNIAEGFERGTTTQLIHFLYYARGSAGEVRSMLAVMQLSKRFEHLKPTIENFAGLAESISRQIRGWANSLQNSEIEGQKYLTDQTRREYESQQRRQQSLADHRQWRQDFEEDLRAKAEQRRMGERTEI